MDRMVEEVASFYKDLYSDKCVSLEAEVIQYCDVVEGYLGKMDVDGLMDPVVEEEVEHALKRMPKSKTMGKDRLSVELYVKFWPLFKKHLVELVTYYMKYGVVSDTMKEGAITLFLKKRG